MLVPVTPTLQAVSKLALDDPDGAAELVRLGLYEAFSDLTVVHGPRLQRVAKRARVAKQHQLRRQLVRAYIDKRRSGEDVSGVLEAAALISKKGTWHWDDHPRDDQGRFKVRAEGEKEWDRQQSLHDKAKEIVDTGSAAAGKPVVVHGDDGDEYEGKLGRQGIEFKDGAEFDDDFSPSHFSIEPQHTSHSEDTAAEGARLAATRPLTAPAAQAPAPKASEPDTSNRTVDFGRDFIGYSRHNEGTLSNPGRFGSNLENFTAPSGSGDRQEGDRRAYRQLAVTGRAVRQISGNVGAGGTVGTLAQVAGELGPQAERVLGPGIRRTAYRYRGTEREPNSTLVREVGDSTDYSSALQAGNHVAVAELRGRGIAAGTAAHYAGGESPKSQHMSPDELDLRLRGDSAVGYFSNKIPNPERAALSIEAGRVPPSQGAIIDRNGNVATEAMGAGSDHYLPFDLKNLKALQGGQYVRTRAAGGPTTEDIYTGLLGGARQLQVVSNSGVFTVELDSSLRGSRRYSDKARQMIGRYQALLERISDSQKGTGRGSIYTQGLSAAEKSKIRADAYERAGYDPELGRTYAANALEEAHQKAMFAGPTDDELEERATQEVDSSKTPLGRTQRAGAIEDRYHQLIREADTERVHRLQLDGEGYYKALQSLQEEFPYFIRNVDFEGLRQFTEDRTQREQGRPPLKGRPRAVDTGFVARGAVTATDRRTKTKASGSTSEGSSGGGGGGDAKPEGSKPKPSGDSGSVRFNRFEPTASLDDSETIKTDLAGSFASIGDVIDKSGPRLDEEDATPAAVSRFEHDGKAMYWLSSYGSQHQGDWSKVGSTLATSGTPKQLRRAIQALNELHSKGTERNHSLQADDEYTSEQQQDVQKTIKLLQRSLAIRNKPVDPQGERALYKPEAGAPAARFSELEGLGGDPDNYAGFLAAQKGNKPFEDAVGELSGKSSDDRATHISGQVDAYQNTLRWGTALKENPNIKAPGNVLPGFGPREAKELASAPAGKHPAYGKLEHLQAAHTFLSQQESAGGGAAPKAPGEHPEIPQYRSGETTPESVRQRQVGKRRLVVHPPGSPIAKAFAEVRKARS